MTIHPVKQAQMALLLAKKIIVLAKYLDFADTLLKKLANVLPEPSGVSKHIMKLGKGKELPYRPIYSLRPVELKTLKTYIKRNLANDFIWASKLPAGAPILFVRKPNNSFCLYVNY